MKKGLTLVEMIIVIGIIGILVAILLSTFSGGTESARAAVCLTNMKKLAASAQLAANNGALGTIRYPLAGNMEVFENTGKKGQYKYSERKGWISWYSKDKYPAGDTQASKDMTVSMYDTDEDRRLYALTNGAIWYYVGRNRSVYLCPSHVIEKKKLKPLFSYVMSAYFGWSPNPGKDLETSDAGLGVSNLHRAERRLLFAEIQFLDDAGEHLTAKGRDGDRYETDAILQYKDCDKDVSCNETIGFNHKTGKNCFANVVFMDGHTEKITNPGGGGTSDSDKQELTKWLCQAKDVVLEDGKYRLAQGEEEE